MRYIFGHYSLMWSTVLSREQEGNDPIDMRRKALGLQHFGIVTNFKYLSYGLLILSAFLILGVKFNYLDTRLRRSSSIKNDLVGGRAALGLSQNLVGGDTCYVTHTPRKECHNSSWVGDEIFQRNIEIQHLNLVLK